MRSRAPCSSRQPGFPAVSLAVAGVVLSAGLAALGQSGPPVVHVQYQLEDSTNQLHVAADTEVQQRATASVCERAARRWPFLQWSATSPTPPAATWTVRVKVVPMEIRDGQGNPYQGAEVRLQHVVGVGGTQRVLSLSPDLEVLYDVYSTQPGPADRTTMVADLERALGRQLLLLLESRETVSFVRQIPLGSRILADQGQQRLLVLLDIRTLQAEPQTQLEAKLSTPGHPPCTMNLEIAREVLEESDLDGCVQARIIWCNALEVETVPTWWDPDLPDLLGGTEKVQVFMRDYHPGFFETAADTGIVDSVSPALPVRCAAGRQP